MNLFEVTVVMTPLAGLVAGFASSRGQSVAASATSTMLGAVIGLLVYPGLLMLLSKVEGRINLGEEKLGRLLVTAIFVYAIAAPYLAYASVATILPPLMRLVG